MEDIMAFDINENISAEQLAKYAVMEVYNIANKTKEFTMRDLFVGYQWDALNSDTKRLAEKLFFQKMHTPVIIQDVGVTSNKNQKFRIV